MDTFWQPLGYHLDTKCSICKNSIDKYSPVLSNLEKISVVKVRLDIMSFINQIKTKSKPNQNQIEIKLKSN